MPFTIDNVEPAGVVGLDVKKPEDDVKKPEDIDFHFNSCEVCYNVDVVKQFEVLLTDFAAYSGLYDEVYHLNLHDFLQRPILNKSLLEDINLGTTAIKIDEEYSSYLATVFQVPNVGNAPLEILLNPRILKVVNWGHVEGLTQTQERKWREYKESKNQLGKSWEPLWEKNITRLDTPKFASGMGAAIITPEGFEVADFFPTIGVLNIGHDILRHAIFYNNNNNTAVKLINAYHLERILEQVALLAVGDTRTLDEYKRKQDMIRRRLKIEQLTSSITNVAQTEHNKLLYEHDVARRRLTELGRKITSSSMHISNIKNNLEGKAERIEAELSRMEKIESYDFGTFQVTIGDAHTKEMEGLKLTTERLTALVPGICTIDVGQFEIYIDLRQGDIRIKGITPETVTSGYWSSQDPHPHVSGRDGVACLGNAAEPIAIYTSDFEIGALASILLSFLENVNPHDDAGYSYRNFIMIDDLGGTLEDKEVQYCDICEDNYGEEDYTRCDRCGYGGHTDCMILVNDGSLRICGTCFSHDYYHCDLCDDIIEKEEICTKCYKDCPYCGEKTSIDRFCEACIEECEKCGATLYEGKECNCELVIDKKEEEE